MSPADVTGPPPELVWLDGLRLPNRPPQLVYLDLNHWIGLAKAVVGHRDGARYSDLLAVCRHALHRGAAQFLLSDTTYVEMSYITDPRQRQNLANVMDELTRFRTLVGRPAAMRLEVRAAIEYIIGPSSGHMESIDLVGYGFGHALGTTGSLILRDGKGNDVSHSIRDRVGPELFTHVMTAADLEMQRGILGGPSDDDLVGMRKLGYAPEKFDEIVARRVTYEQALTAELDSEPKWRRGRLRDAIGARELVDELLDMVLHQLAPRGMTIGDLVQRDRSRIRAFTRSMPSTEVAIEVKKQYHRDSKKKWSRNDIHDIDAVAIAVPYCDVVFTDAAIRNALVSAGIDRRMCTAIPRKIADLASLLEGMSDPTTTRT